MGFVCVRWAGQSRSWESCEISSSGGRLADQLVVRRRFPSNLASHAIPLRSGRLRRPRRPACFSGRIGWAWLGREGNRWREARNCRLGLSDEAGG